MGMAHSQNSAASMLAATPKRNKWFMDKKVISKKSLMNLPGFRWGGEGGAGTPILYPAFISLHNNISTDIRGNGVQLINLLPLIVCKHHIDFTCFLGFTRQTVNKGKRHE